MVSSSPARSYPLHGLIKVITVVFIFLLSFLPPKSDGSLLLNERKSLESDESKIGSKPPACVNKCMNCSPCMATLVIPNNNDPPKGRRFKVYSSSSSHRDDDDTYYLLHWKCRCGNKLYQP